MIRRGRTVTVRDFTRPDVDEMSSWPKYTEPQFAWANFDPRSEFDKDVWFSAGQSSTSRRYAILDEQGQLIGVIGLRNIDPVAGEATLGIRLSANKVNQGYGTDAIMTLLDYAFNHMGLHRVNLDVAEDNPRARRCYEKCGFTCVGRRLNYDGTSYVDMTISRYHFQRPRRPNRRQSTNTR
ncbi:MAG: GNAT family N-acetyltransferase [Chloroflexota bacterium]